MCLCTLGLFAVGCSDDNEPVHFEYADGGHFVDYVPENNYKGSHTILLQRSLALELCGLENVDGNDQFLAKNQDSGVVTYLDWGYKYAGIQGNPDGSYDRVSYNDTILVGLGFSDTWRVGKYDLLLLRGKQYQKLDEFDFKILDNVDVDLTKAKGGIIEITADGWDVAGSATPIDSLRFVDKATGQEVFTVASAHKPENEKEIIQFDRSKFETGDYELWINRWDYGFTQKLAEFGYFKYEFVDSNPMKQDEAGNYVLKFTVDQFADEDRFVVTTNAPHVNAYVHQKARFEEANWNAETKVYTYTLNEKYWKKSMKDGMTFAVQMNLGGIRNLNVTGDAVLHIEGGEDK